MNKHCANEHDYHQMVIDSMDRFPDELKFRPGLHAFVWAHEAGMHDAGRGGGNGAADLLTVDEEGLVWLIEAKFGSNPEHRQFVWGQIGRYRDAVAAMSWQKLLHYAEAFLMGREGTKPSDPIGRGAQSFEQVLANWQKRIDRVLVPPSELNGRMAEALRAGRYGIMVLADTYLPDVVEHGRAFPHTGPVAYVQGVPVEDGVDFCVRWYRPAAADSERKEIAVAVDSRFDAYLSETNIHCAIDGFENSLCPGARRLWLEVLRPGLVDGLKWDGTVARRNEKSFGVAFPVKGASTPLFSVGWTGSDSKAVARENKLAGNASMRVDVQFNWMASRPFFTEEFLNEWAGRFHQHGWRGRVGPMETWGTRRIPMAEFNASGGVMQYRPFKEKGFTGRPGDEEALRGFLVELAAMIDEIRVHP